LTAARVKQSIYKFHSACCFDSLDFKSRSLLHFPSLVWSIALDLLLFKIA